MPGAAKPSADQLVDMFDDVVNGRADHGGLSAGDVVNLILDDVLDLARDLVFTHSDTEVALAEIRAEVEARYGTL